MRILTIRTDRPDAELGIYDGETQLASDTWLAHRQLAETLHIRIAALLKGCGLLIHDIEGIACFQGPGSFTGLRIGLTVANTLAYSLEVPIVAGTDDEVTGWQSAALRHLLNGENDTMIMPEYGAEPHITLPKLPGQASNRLTGPS